jgi:signal transduction histidine kinase
VTPHTQQSERPIRKALVGTDRRTRRLSLVLVNGSLITILTLIYLLVFSITPQFGLTTRKAHFLATVIVAVTVIPLRAQLTTMSRWLLQREWLDSQSLIRDVADTLGHTIDPAAIGPLLTFTLPDELHLSGATIWMLQPPDDRVFLPVGAPGDDAKLLALGASALHIAHADSYVLVSDDQDATWTAPFLARRTTLVIPLRVGSRLIGIYGFGPPLGQNMYPPHVIGVLLTLAPAIASALENARAYTKIARLNEQLSSFDRRKDEFIESIGHELRTPLTSLSLATQLVVARPDVAGELAVVMNNNVQRLQDLIDRILAMALTETDAPQPYGPIDVPDLIDELITPFVPIAYSRHITIVLDVEPELQAIGDPARLRWALNELIDNAVRYAAPGCLTIGGIARDGLALINISDQGPGIPADEQGELFSRFFRGRQTRALAATPGAGIGLSIAQREVERLGGQLWLEHTGPAGTTMCLAVPTPALPERAETEELRERAVGEAPALGQRLPA